MTTKKTAAKTAKPAAKTTKPTATTEPATKASKPVSKAKTPPTHEEIAQLAKQYWIEGGHREGHAEQDWIRAEQKLSGK